MAHSSKGSVHGHLAPYFWDRWGQKHVKELFHLTGGESRGGEGRGEEGRGLERRREEGRGGQEVGRGRGS